MVYNITLKWCMYVCLLGLLGLCNTFPIFKKYVMVPKGFMGYLERGSAFELNSFRHEEYPFDSSNQNNWTYGVCRLHQIGYCFLFRFWSSYVVPLQVSIYMWRSLNNFWYTLRKVLHMHWVNFRHKQYPSNSLHQYYLMHNVCRSFMKV